MVISHNVIIFHKYAVACVVRVVLWQILLLADIGCSRSMPNDIISLNYLANILEITSYHRKGKKALKKIAIIILILIYLNL